MRRKYWLLTVCILIFLFIGIYMYNYSGEFVSRNLSDIENITITLYPYDEDRLVTKTIDSGNEIEKVYNILKETSNIRNNRYPSHAVSVQWDPKFIIDIVYGDGETDHIFSTEANGAICKYLNSKGSSGDRGYRLGKNQLIWDYILKQFFAPDFT